MKYILTVLAFVATSALAGDYDETQHNASVRVGDWGVGVRAINNSDNDHIELRYSGIKDVDLGFRYVNNPVNVERRYKFTYNAWSNDNFYVAPRIEYRDFENADNYFRIRPTFGATTALGVAKVYAEFTPMFHVGDTTRSDFKFATTQTKVGFDVDITKNVRFGPYIQYETDSSFHKTDVQLGTSLAVKF